MRCHGHPTHCLVWSTKLARREGITVRMCAHCQTTFEEWPFTEGDRARADYTWAQHADGCPRKKKRQRDEPLVVLGG